MTDTINKEVVLSDAISQELIEAMVAIGFVFIDDAVITTDEFEYHVPAQYACCRSWFFYKPNLQYLIQVRRQYQVYADGDQSYWSIQLMFGLKTNTHNHYCLGPTLFDSDSVLMTDEEFSFCGYSSKHEQFYDFYCEERNSYDAKHHFLPIDVASSVARISNIFIDNVGIAPFADWRSYFIRSTSYAFLNSEAAFFAQLDASRFKPVIGNNKLLR